MRTLFQLLFLVFYVASSYAAGQMKVEQVVQELEHATSGSEEDLGIDRACTGINHALPKYREAKKATYDFQFRPVEIVDLAPSATARLFAVHESSLHVQLTLDRSHPRAPPTLS